MLGLSTSLVKGGAVGRTYIKDGLKLYMPYKGADTTKGTQFVGTGSTSFDGDGDYISISSTTYNVHNTSYSFAFWVKLSDPTGVHSTIFGNSGEANEQFISFNTNGNLYLETSDNDEAMLASYSQDKQWHHYVLTIDGIGGGQIYEDGVALTTSFAAGDGGGASALENAVTFDRIGISNTIRDLKGSLKNISIWDRALTATEVQNVMYKSYAEVSGRLGDSTLASWWALDVDYTDSHGDNDGTNSGSTLDTDLYGGDTPVKPRAIDNAPTVQADAIGSGSALFVESNTDYIDIGNNADLGSTDFTLTAWCKSTEWTSKFILSKWYDTNNRWKWGADSNDKLQFWSRTSAVSEGIAFTGSASLTSHEDKWVHLAITADRNGNISGYINGVLDDADAEAGALDFDATIDNSGNLSIGFEDEANEYFDGNICQVGIWDAVLDQEQIQSIMEKTYEELTASEKEDLVSYWALDETIESSGSGASFVYDKVDATLGSEIVVDGDFPNGDNWNEGTDWSISGGKAHVDCSSTSALSKSSFPITSGKTYIMSLDISNYVAGALQMQFGGGQVLGSTASDGNWYVYATSTSTNPILYLYAINTTELSVSNVSVKQVQGNAGELI